LSDGKVFFLMGQKKRKIIRIEENWFLYSVRPYNYIR
jgi:hypothetical protein